MLQLKQLSEDFGDSHLNLTLRVTSFKQEVCIKYRWVVITFYDFLLPSPLWRGLIWIKMNYEWTQGREFLGMVMQVHWKVWEWMGRLKPRWCLKCQAIYSRLHLRTRGSIANLLSIQRQNIWCSVPWERTTSFRILGDRVQGSYERYLFFFFRTKWN